MNIQLLVNKFVQTWRREGMRITLRKVFANFGNLQPVDDFDLKYGTDTSGLTPLWKFQIHSPNVRFGERYEATPEQELVEAIRFLEEDLQTFTFVDLGCGKGRTLLVASKLGFKAVIGVEFALELAEIARSNLAKMGIGHAAVMHADAADFRFPSGNTIVYLYNPFSQEVARKVIENLRKSRLGKLYVIYKGPKCAEIFDACGFLGRLGCPPAVPHIQVWGKVA